MYKAIYVRGALNEPERENLAAMLLMRGALGSEERENGFVIYFSGDSRNYRKEILSAIKSMGLENVQIEDEIELEDENWNENWKRYFKPVIVGRFCVRPPWESCEAGKTEIIVSPKMAFGTGTHETTQLMLEYISEHSLEGQKVLDAGCGSGVLSIASILNGAESVTAFDIDPLAIENSRENIALNNIDGIQLFTGDITAVPSKDFDWLLANINTNILLELADDFWEKVKAGGKLALSGLLLEDIQKLKDVYEKKGFIHTGTAEAGEWGRLEFEKGSV